jgi:hypothetical protein
MTALVDIAVAYAFQMFVDEASCITSPNLEIPTVPSFLPMCIRYVRHAARGKLPVTSSSVGTRNFQNVSL